MRRRMRFPAIGSHVRRLTIGDKGPVTRVFGPAVVQAVSAGAASRRLANCPRSRCSLILADFTEFQLANVMRNLDQGLIAPVGIVCRAR
jgi:hypothetical protein